ncbi:hypothetical protein L1049_014461 [Liquidambar formosana]|uniref:J domain-containing protein n=1 Tax=Liquidambar formosana TaxID=63359 RepID=A0AAP0S208_LIQFO
MAWFRIIDGQLKGRMCLFGILAFILGIPKSATIKDICKAYKSLVLKWHPDKNPYNKTEAEAKFNAINEAYKELNKRKIEEEARSRRGDEQTMHERSYRHRSVDDGFFSRPTFLSRTASRRSNTPTPNSTPLSRNTSPMTTTTTPTDSPTSPSKSSTNQGSSTTPAEFPTSLSKSVSRKSTTPIIFSQSAAWRKPQPIEKKLECTLEELCKGCVKKVKITRDVMTDTGITVQEEEILKIRVKPGWKKGTKITFEGKGDERPGMLPADIIFLIDEKRHPLFKRDGDDLEIVVEVPLVQALTGCSLPVPLLGGEEMFLYVDDIMYPGYEKIIRGQGMPKSKEKGKRGDLRIRFLVEFPTELSDEQRSDIFSILQESS